MFETLDTQPKKTAKDALHDGYGNIESHLPIGDYEPSGLPGDIKNALHEKDNKKVMIVRTNTGAIVGENREILTERLSGCVALFLRGPGFRYLTHLTPSGCLGYYYHRYGDADAADMLKKISKEFWASCRKVRPKKQYPQCLLQTRRTKKWMIRIAARGSLKHGERSSAKLLMQA